MNVNFNHRLSDQIAIEKPGSDLALVGNLGACLDRIKGIAEVIRLLDENSSVGQAALAARKETEDAEAILNAWDAAKRKQEATA